MKKLLYLLIVPFVLVSCQKEPDFDKLSDDYLVVTTYDPDYDFTSPNTSVVYVPTTIKLLDNDSGEPDVWDDSDSRQIIAKFTQELKDAGYTVVNTTAAVPAPDLWLDVAFIENTTYFIDYPYYWWWDPYYWDGGYWPGWYYPYPIVYGYSTGSLIAELLIPGDLAVPAVKAEATLPSVWYAYIAGDESGSEDYDTERIVTGVNKAFTQSKYISAK